MPTAIHQQNNLPTATQPQSQPSLTPQINQASGLALAKSFGTVMNKALGKAIGKAIEGVNANKPPIDKAASNAVGKNTSKADKKDSVEKDADKADANEAHATEAEASAPTEAAASLAQSTVNAALSGIALLAQALPVVAVTPLSSEMAASDSTLNGNTLSVADANALAIGNGTANTALPLAEATGPNALTGPAASGFTNALEDANNATFAGDPLASETATALAQVDATSLAQSLQPELDPLKLAATAPQENANTAGNLPLQMATTVATSEPDNLPNTLVLDSLKQASDGPELGKDADLITPVQEEDTISPDDSPIDSTLGNAGADTTLTSLLPTHAKRDGQNATGDQNGSSNSNTLIGHAQQNAAGALPASQQVSQRLIEQYQLGKREITFQLNPETLGQVRVQLTSVGPQQVASRLIVQTPEAMQNLQQDMHQLKQALARQGISLEHMTVVMAGSDLNQTATRNDASQNGGSDPSFQQSQNSGGFQNSASAQQQAFQQADNNWAQQLLNQQASASPWLNNNTTEATLTGGNLDPTANTPVQSRHDLGAHTVWA
jgi:hypothetical protein